MKAFIIYTKTTILTPDGKSTPNPIIMPDVVDDWARAMIETLSGEDPPLFVPLKLTDGIMLIPTGDILRVLHVDMIPAQPAPDPNVQAPPKAQAVPVAKPKRKRPRKGR